MTTIDNRFDYERFDRKFREFTETLKRFHETMELVRRYSSKPNTKPPKYEMWKCDENYPLDY